MATQNVKADWGRASLNTDAAPYPADVVRALVDDLATVKIPTVTSANASDLASAITLLNEIKTKLNAIAATTLSVVKA